MALDASDLDLPRLLVVGLFVSLLLSVGFAASTSTAAFGTYNPGWDGGRELRLLATDTGLTTEIAQETTAYQRVRPNTTIAVVLSPTTSYAPAERAHLRAFVRNGGTLVVAEDFGSATNALLTALGVETRIAGPLLRDERHYYRSPAMPLATNVTDHALTGGSEQLTLNYGTYLDPGSDATVLARTSPYAYPDANRNAKLDANESLGAYPVAAVEHVGSGRVVVVSDPSLFINRMLNRPGNRAFVTGLFTGTDGGAGAGAETLLLDYSHTAPQPPLAAAVLLLRDSTALQFGLSLLLFGLLGVWGWRGWSPLTSLTQHFRRQPVQEPVLSRQEIVAAIERAHPEWDVSRVERVAEVIQVSHESEDNG